ncbi:MAG: 3-methyladenine DNA glycosylase, partial [Nocardioides sp.]
MLSESSWRARAVAHEARVDGLVAPHLTRRQDGVQHPVHDFLFTYYSQRPAQLRRWHPGFGVALADAEEYGGRKGYAVVDGVAAATLDHAAAPRPLPDATYTLLTATAARNPHVGCF